MIFYFILYRNQLFFEEIYRFIIITHQNIPMKDYQFQRLCRIFSSLETFSLFFLEQKNNRRYYAMLFIALKYIGYLEEF